MTDPSELEARVRELMDDLQLKAAAFPAEVRPGFELERADAGLTLTLTTDNGGGPATSHPIAHTFRLHAHVAGVDCTAGDAAHRHGTVEEVVHCLRTALQAHLPHERDFFLG